MTIINVLCVNMQICVVKLYVQLIHDNNRVNGHENRKGTIWKREGTKWRDGVKGRDGTKVIKIHDIHL